MIGNDLVDLREAGFGSRAGTARYWQKVLVKTERERWLRAAPDLPLLWGLWAAKESAYKLERRRGQERTFRPGAYEVVSFLETDPACIRGCVCGELGKYPLYGLRTKEYIHVLCCDPAISGACFQVVSPDASPPIPLQGARIKKLPSGALVAVWPNRSTCLPVSKSHHGRFQAWAWPSSEARVCQNSKPPAGG